VVAGTPTETTDFNTVLSPLLGAVAPGTDALGAALLTPDGKQTGTQSPASSMPLTLPEGLDLASMLQQSAAVAGNALPVDGKALPVADGESPVQAEGEAALPLILPQAGVTVATEELPVHDATAVEVPKQTDDELLAELAIPSTVVPAAGAQVLPAQPVPVDASGSDAGTDKAAATDLSADQSAIIMSAQLDGVAQAAAPAAVSVATAENQAAETLAATALPSNSKPMAQRGEASASAAAPVIQSADGQYEPASIEQAVPDLLSLKPGAGADDEVVKAGGFGRLLEAQTASNTNSQQPSVDTGALGSKVLTGAVAYRMEGNTQVATTLVNQPLDTPQWSNEIGERVVWFGANKIQHAEIELDPPELGPLQVRISTQNDQTSVTFTSHHAAVREVLDQSLPRLKEMFSEQGLNLVQADVGERRGSQQQQQFEMTDSAAAADNAGSDDDGDTSVASTAKPAKMRLGLVDAYA
jgi:flagellar hook-length control protein FliK